MILGGRSIRGSIIAVVMACTGAVDPATNLRTELTLTPRQVGPGESVTAEVRTTNYGRATVYTAGCGPGMDVEVADPRGARTTWLAGQTFVCPLYDSNALEPGETDTVRLQWRAPNGIGNYRMRAGVRLEKGLAGLSVEQLVVVR